MSRTLLRPSRLFAASGAVALGAYGYYLMSPTAHPSAVSPEEMARQRKICESYPTRAEQLKKLKQGKEYDLLVIGGGATGVGVALDATTRGLTVALVEKGDFASGTSSKSTKLVHGGVRYLEKAFWDRDIVQYRMVKEALFERSILLDIAPHLTKVIPIMIPIFTWWQIPYFWAGSKAYDVVAGSHNLESSYLLSRDKTLETFPLLKQNNLKASMIYHDGQSNDSKLNVAIALTAAAHGADLSNYVTVDSLVKKDGVVKGAIVEDSMTGEKWEIKAKGVINATGPYTDHIRKMADSGVSDIVAPSAGTHVVLPGYFTPMNIGLLDPATSDGRVIFFLPWEGSTVVGTTDVATKIVDNPAPTEEEIQWILEEVRKYLAPNVDLRREDVLSAWAGIRPLVKDPNKTNTESLARNHIVHTSPSQLLTVSGGKWTTYRSMATDTVDEAVKVFHLPSKSPSMTEKVYLVGAHNYSKTLYIKLIQNYRLGVDVAKHLVSSYGDRAEELAKMTAHLKPLAQGHPFLEAEVLYATRKEYAETAADVLARRMRLAFLDVREAYNAVPRVVELMGKELNWSKERQQREITQTVAFLRTMGLSESDVKSK